MIGIGAAAGSGRVLDFDIESRPLSYYGERPTAEITCIASCWVGEPDSMEVVLLTADDDGPSRLLVSFLQRYEEADLVTGHYIRGFDLPMINGALIEAGLPTLGAKMASDTKCDMTRKMDIPATQEYLCQALGIELPKVHMTQADWREANRLGSDGLRKTYARATGDVRQHMALREEMLRRGLLRGPRIWSPGGGFTVPDWAKEVLA